MPRSRLTASIAVVALALLAPVAAAGAAPPETTITAGPTGLTNDGSPSFSFASDQPDSTFACRLDGGIWTPRAPLGPTTLHVLDPRWEPCTSPWAYENVEDGPHAFEVRATTPADEADPTPATREFVVDADVEAALVARGTQRQPRRRVRVRLAIHAREALAAAVAGAITVERPGGGARARHELDPRSAKLAAGQSIALRLGPAGRGSGRAIAAALREGRRADARLTVSLADALGTSVTRPLTIRLRARSRR